jgi:hypothetical protein
MSCTGIIWGSSDTIKEAKYQLLQIWILIQIIGNDSISRLAILVS